MKLKPRMLRSLAVDSIKGVLISKNPWTFLQMVPVMSEVSETYKAEVGWGGMAKG